MTTSFHIVYQHPDFLVLDKPPGLSVHKDEHERGLVERVADATGHEKLWLVHRLDKVTSGLLILAKNAQSAVQFQQLFAQKAVEKQYIALAMGKPKKKQGLIIGDMQKARNGSWRLSKTQENPAITRFYSQSVMPNLRLYHLWPKTGKTHQLRVAMKSLGVPILGDRRYAGEQADRTYLHAYALQFAYNGQTIAISCAPKCGQWFQDARVQQAINLLHKHNTG
ncbi:TIGR01621 family pseudouridine synthase [Pasteurellaceae bacterium HPA106]|uniref:TIGR01621 family pseudouridine synthase n=1 Tax=Spirabiliibacterium pneumoniae TaxID=221400 RepID=UPI001AAD3A8B|nr:TIGR01621 family pseudouridine synthase [Spirabiliibacterium pneumoniae]MBE2896487.1 TIGR01621 family pseudouridine synthase [Spirabiliibacterium pneumoniae]